MLLPAVRVSGGGDPSCPRAPLINPRRAQAASPPPPACGPLAPPIFISFVSVESDAPLMDSSPCVRARRRARPRRRPRQRGGAVGTSPHLCGARPGASPPTHSLGGIGMPPIPSHPIPSHPIPSHPIPSLPPPAQEKALSYIYVVDAMLSRPILFVWRGVDASTATASLETSLSSTTPPRPTDVGAVCCWARRRRCQVAKSLAPYLPCVGLCMRAAPFSSSPLM